jgi:histidine triad (HIT) family protein
MENCVFCKLANHEIKRKTIYENDNFFSISDANPKAEGHSLVISKKHFKTTLDL